MAKTIATLRTELKAKEGKLKKLRAEKREITGRLKALDGRISALKGAGPGPAPVRKKKTAPAGRRGRGKNRRSLGDVLAAVLKGKGSVKVAQAAELALGAGYKTASKQFGNIVSQALSDDKRFKKLGRGVYVLGGGPAAAAAKPKKAPAKPKKAAAKKSPKAAAGKGRKGPQPGSLITCLIGAMTAKKPISVKDAMRAVLAAGYKSKSPDFRTIVNQTLSKGEQFKKTGRGIYVLKG